MDKILKALDKARAEQKQRENSISTPKILRQPNESEGSSADVRSSANNIVTLNSEKETKAHSLEQKSVGAASIDPKLIVFHEPESLAAEHFKLLRSRIVNPPEGQEFRTILVTSALENAGKTFVACNLSLSIAQGVDPYALLIDADIRKPSVHKMMGIKPEAGLSEYLSGAVQLPQCLVKSIITKLTILPAGSSVPNPAEVVTSSKMKDLLEEAKARYHDRFIIIDSPPVNLASETVDLAKIVDAVLLVVRSGASSRPMVEQAIKSLGKDKIMGVVFNCYERPSGKYGYYKKKTGYYG